MATMAEISRLIRGLRRIGLTEEQINDFLLYIEDGDEKVFEDIEKSRAKEN